MASRHPALPLNRVVTCVLLGAGAVGIAHLLLVADVRSLIPWLAGGVGTGLALRWGQRAVWPMALGAAFMAIALGYPLPGALLPALATFSGAFVLAMWLERLHIHPDFGRRSDVLSFVAAGLPAALLPPLISIAGLAALGGNSGIPDPVLRTVTWWCHSAIALLLLAPAVATISRPRMRSWMDDGRTTALMVVSLVGLVAGMRVLDDDIAGIWIPPLCVVATLVATLRRDLAFGSLHALTLVTAFTLFVADGTPAWVFALVLAASVLVVNVLMTERDAAQRRAADIAERQRLALLDAATQEQQRIGRDLHDTLGQELTAIALLARAIETQVRGLPDGAQRLATAQAVVELCGTLVEMARSFSRTLLAPVDDLARQLALLRASAPGSDATKASLPAPLVDIARPTGTRRDASPLLVPAFAGIAFVIGALAAPVVSPLAWVTVGLAAGVTLRWGWVAGLWVLAGDALGGVAAGNPPAAIAAGTMAAAAAALVFAAVLRHFGFRPEFTRLRDVAQFVGGASVAAVPAAAFALAAPQPPLFASAWMYASIMVLVVGLPILTVSSRVFGSWQRGSRIALGLGAVVAIVATALVVRVPGLQWVALVGLLAVIAGAMRLGIAFAGLSVAMLSLSHSTGVMLHLTSEAQAVDLLIASQLWSYALILSAVVLSVQALLAEREASERRLQEMVAGARIALLAAAIHEQERIGRTLQHGLGREIAGLSAGVRDLEAKLRQDAPAIADEALELALACEQAQASALAISHGLTPPILRDGDLLMALRALAGRVPAAAGTRVTVVAGLGLRLPLESCRDVYRIVQEALNNALKHANARTVDIALRDVPDGVEIVVADDGAGLSRSAANGSGLGMRTMQYRATVAGGRLRIESSPDGGTRVICTLPRMRPAGRAATVTARPAPSQDFDPAAIAVGP